ncbi:MAG TPA: ABC transporter permease [Gemmatimonadaceae bacterium]|nr:ABC transporter permease [Gemmatimonadaceae bacterium]
MSSADRGDGTPLAMLAAATGLLSGSPLERRAGLRPRTERHRMDTFLQDIRYSARRLLRSPGFTLIAVVTLALGIGANTAIFSVVNAVLLRPLPYADSERLVRVLSMYESSENSVSPLDYLDWKAQARSFSGLAALSFRPLNLTGGEEPQRLEGAGVTADFFSVLGTKPLLGRVFGPEDDQPGLRNIVLNERLWRSRFGADPRLVGATVQANGESYTVVGIVPAAEAYPRRADAWVPMAFSADERLPPNRGRRFMQVVGRLKPGVTAAQADNEMRAIAARLAQQYPEQNTGLSASARGLREYMVGNIRTPLLVLMGAVGFVMLIACANVANLLLVRAAGRETELAVRAALGAGRGRVVRQLVTESVVLSLVGGAAALALAAWGVELFKRFAPAGMPRVDDVRVDAGVLLFTFGVALATGILFGLVPALGVARPNLAQTLREGARGSRTRPGSHRVRRILVASEIALAVMLLAGAGLLIRSFVRLSNVDPGFRPERVMTFALTLPDARYPDAPQKRRFTQELTERLARVPGARAAGVVSYLPMTNFGMGSSFTVAELPPVPRGQEPGAAMAAASPGYFAAMGIPVRRGRDFTAADREGGAKAVIVNEALVRRIFGEQEPLGKHLRFDPIFRDAAGDWEIVGVVGDVRSQGLANEVAPMFWMPYAQAPSLLLQFVSVAVRTAGEPEAITNSLRAEVRQLDPDLPLVNLRPLETIVADTVSQPRFYMMLLAAFAAVALLLSAVGIYGVMAYAVTLRTSEIGIRIALGASARDVLGQVLREGMAVALVGVVAGGVAALWLTGVLRGLLYGVSATDPVTFAAVTVVLLAVAALACFLPARRATRVDPMIAMRTE